MPDSLPAAPASPPARFSPAKIPAALPLLMALLGLFTLLVPRTLRVNVTPSVPLGIYRIVEAPARRGSLVEICLPPGLASLALRRGYTGHGPCPGGTRPLLKIALAFAGDRIVLTRLGVAKDGLLLPTSAPRSTDSRARPLPRLRLGLHRLPPGSVWLYGPHPRSFDSRVFGPVSIDLLRNALAPLCTTP
ncbi:MAG TPA: conjugative transfer signal peptidase TraF [Acidobacteria bacterium]|nr:conjugative transfer signal peptidase TraF [Acidobacteriota bacterium]